MKILLTLIQRSLRSLGREAKRDDGVVALVIAIALIAAAASLIAATARQNKEAEVARLSGNAKSVRLMKDSVLAYFLTDPDGAGVAVRNGIIPCPDTDFPPDGLSNGTTTCTANTGVVPYLSLGLNQDDVIDSYGNYFTYAVTGGPARSVCTSVTNSYDSTQTEFTGTIEEPTDTSVQPSNDTYYYAFISHGKNGLGAISRANTRRSAPSSANEIQNCPSNNSNCTDPSSVAIVSGPQDATVSGYFDDSVFLSTRKQFSSLCSGLTPSGKANAFVNESFDGTATGSLPSSLSGARSTANVQTATGSTASDRALRFAGTSAAVSTVTQFNPAERSNYISFQWRPTALSTNNEVGISLGLRATLADIGTGTDEDIFDQGSDDGITIRFYEDTSGSGGNTGAGDNTIYICDNTETACDTNDNLAESSTFTLTLNQAYLVEAYDDGTQIWARITQVSAPSNTATAFVTSIPAAQQDIAPSNSIFLINHSNSTSEVDNLVIGRGAMVAAFDGTDDIISTAADSHDTSTGNLTLEAAIYPDTLPTGSNRRTIIAKWTDGGANAVQSYRLSLTASGVTLDVAGDDAAGGSTIITQTHNFGYRPSTGEWTHLAVTYNETNQTATLYVDGEVSGISSASTFDGNGVNNGTARFSIGADLGSGIVNEFDGNIADVRVWASVRTASEIFRSYNRRAPLSTSSAADLIVNWTLDRATTASTLPIFGGTANMAGPTLASTDGAAGTLSGATFAGALQTYFPAFSTTASFCATGAAGTGTVVSPYQCEFRNTSQSGDILIPNNLPFIHVKAWGGGGGGYDTLSNESAGGAGGFSAGRLSTINGFSIAGALGLRVDVGGAGVGSASTYQGAGGGGASGIWRDVDDSNTVTAGDFAGIVAGGGGGASFADDNFGSGDNCNSAGECGPASGGGGPGNLSATLSNVLTTRAPDYGDDECGGRGGNNSPSGASPPLASRCSSGGTDPVGTAGGTGGGTASGGASILGAGGSGANGSSAVSGVTTYGFTGSGGGGGGVSITGLTAGGGEAGGFGYNNLSLPADILALITFLLSGDVAAGGFGGGGGAGFIDTGTLNVNPYGIRGGAPTPGVTSTDPDYAPTYCTAGGTPCPTNAAVGGTPNGTAATSTASGQRGAVVIKW